MPRAFARSIAESGLVLVVAFHMGLAIARAQVGAQMPARASNPPATLDKKPALLPDIAGLRPGITLQEALKLLKAHNPKAAIKVGEVHVPEMGSKPIPVMVLSQSPRVSGTDPPEIIQLELTLPPGKPVVWGILRQLVFEAGTEKTRAALLAELRQKYGQEGFGLTIPIVSVYWVFDEQGRRAETGGAALGNCARPGAWDIALNESGVRASSTFRAYSPLLGRPAPNQGPCKPLVHVRAMLQPAMRVSYELIESTTVAVIDGALAARAQAATAAYRANVVEKQKKQGLK